VRVHEAILARQKLPRRLVTKRIWTSGSRHRGVRALSRAQRHGNPQVLPARLAQGTEEALLWSAWTSPEALEIRRRGRSRAAVLERLYGGLPGRDRATAAKHAPWYVVPADNKCSRGSSSPPRSSRRWRKLDLAYPKIDAATEIGTHRGARGAPEGKVAAPGPPPGHALARGQEPVASVVVPLWCTAPSSAPLSAPVECPRLRRPPRSDPMTDLGKQLSRTPRPVRQDRAALPEARANRAAAVHRARAERLREARRRPRVQADVPWDIWTDWSRYAVDVAQRSTLFWTRSGSAATSISSTRGPASRRCCTSITRSCSTRAPLTSR